jgi:hypothetical protein
MGIADRPEAMSLAHQGLAGAAWRTLDAARRKHLLSCAVAATEFLHWICALDEQLKNGDPGYEKRRDKDEEGQVIPGLRYGRDRAMHQVVICAAKDVRGFFNPRPGGMLHIATSYPIWAPTATLPPAEGNHHKPKLMEAYEQHVAERKAWQPLFMALEFLTRELKDKVSLVSIAQPDWFQELSDEERLVIHQNPMLNV